MAYPFLDLWAVVALAVVGTVVQLEPLPMWAKATVGLPLVLLCPGYALVSALFASRSLGWIERTVFGIGLSLATASLGAVAFNWSPWGLASGVWAGLFLGVTVAASFVATRRRGRGMEPTKSSAAQRPIRIDHLALLGAAGLIAIAAVTLARSPRPVTGVVGYTMLWMTPVSPPGPTQVEVGFTSNELSEADFRLEVTVNGQALWGWDNIALAPGETWRHSLDLSQIPAQSGMVEARLYKLSTPDSVYRVVGLQH
jgi:Protein of unknown function (DUF1616)